MLNKLKIALLKARKEKDTLRMSVLSFLLSAIHNKEIALRGKSEIFDDSHVVGVLNEQVKQRKESIEQYKTGGRQDLVDKETAELGVLEEISREYVQ